LAQAAKVKADLESRHAGLEVEVVMIRTSGDKGDRFLLGSFVREIQEDLANKKVDIALHCLKDLPTDPVPGLQLSAYLEREDARDTLISRGPTLSELRPGSVVGTGSLRRTSQLAAIREDLVFKPLVGNVDTRMRKLMEGEYDSIVLAIAGLRRLGLLDDWNNGDYRPLSVHPLQFGEMLPAPGQAVLVLETRADDDSSMECVRPLNHAATEICSREERAFLRTFGGGCSVPVAAFAQVASNRIELRGLIASPDGARVIRGSESAPLGSDDSLGRRLGAHLGNQGGFEIVEAVIASRALSPGGSNAASA
jgi:hydroxymethylbilane synthase